ncbi:MAG: PKD domain-containing protein [Bacteroidales bacterium]|nr:PKD domain-containing protein [Bacteroidales bacterium]
MRSYLSIILLCAMICQAPGQTPDAYDVFNTCDAAFTTIPDPGDPMTLHFQDQSSGQITLWQWSFGDGTTTTIQNPVHTYPAGGTYFVCLTVSNSDSGYICHDVLCVAITIHEPGTCVADYHYTVDTLNHLQTNFYDQSSGNINRWHWDFGDGSFSDERNPVHTFPTYEKYRVCLLAFNADSVSVCSDVKCDSVEIKPAAICHAGFTSDLDSLNPAPNTFIFKNTSSGDANRFLWSFDDGSTYQTPDVTHQFQSPGIHEVCLIIRREEHGKIVCSDSLCRSITMANYFDLGGHLFAGSFPINNPVSSGDTGVVHLFRIGGARLIPYDTCVFTKLGYYAFPQTLNGSYVIKASLTPGSRNYAAYFPAYYQQALLWKESNAVDLSKNNAYLSDIHLLPAKDTLSGTGMISGIVVNAKAKDNPEEIPFAEVLLFNGQINPIRFTVSGKSGKFAFKNLPFGDYHLYVEYPGRYSRYTAVWLDSSAPSIDSIRLEVFDHDVTSVPGKSSMPFTVGELFPNPASNMVNLTIDVARETMIKFEIWSLTGLVVWSGSHNCVPGSNMVTIPVGTTKTGLYLFMIKTMDGFPIAVKKMLRY